MVTRPSRLSARARLEGRRVVAERAAPAALEPLHAALLGAPGRLDVVLLCQPDCRLVPRRRLVPIAATGRREAAVRRAIGCGGVGERVVVLARVEQVGGAIGAVAVGQRAE